MIDLTIDEMRLARGVAAARERRIIIPTFAQMNHPETAPAGIREKLAGIAHAIMRPASCTSR